MQQVKVQVMKALEKDTLNGLRGKDTWFSSKEVLWLAMKANFCNLHNVKNRLKAVKQRAYITFGFSIWLIQFWDVFSRWKIILRY